MVVVVEVVVVVVVVVLVVSPSSYVQGTQRYSINLQKLEKDLVIIQIYLSYLY